MIKVRDENELDRVPYKHVPKWEDVVYFQHFGMWPEGRVPDWAEERSHRWHDCGPTSKAVFLTAAYHEIDRLRRLVEAVSEERDELAARIDHYRDLEDVLNSVVDGIEETEMGMCSLSRSLDIAKQLRTALGEAREEDE